MLDVHPPHESAHSWKDFFLHIATIVVGLLIAVGLEQTVEALHHRRQRAELTEQMRVEAEHNLPIIRESLARLEAQRRYLETLSAALAAGKVSGDSIDVAGVVPFGGSVVYVSPSRATWTAAQGAGLVDVLAPEQAKLYARLDYNATEEIRSEDLMYEALRIFIGECKRSHYEHTSAAASHITVAHRDDLLFYGYEAEGSLSNMMIRLAIMQGADEAIDAGVKRLEDMYPYQGAVLARVPVDDAEGGFYGGDSDLIYKVPDVPNTSKR